MKPTIIRYLLFAIHTSLTLAIFLITLLVFLDQSTLLIPPSIALGIWLIYSPAAIIISARNSSNRFDQGGLEVAYLVVQQVLALGMLIHPTLTFCPSRG